MVDSVTRVVVMDDHPIVREGLVHVINREPDLTVVGDSGQPQDAEKLIETHRPDVLLLDVQMEGPTFGLIGRTKLIHPDLKVVFITAFDTEKNLEQATIMGAQGFVSKLAPSEQICEALRKVVKGEYFFRESAPISTRRKRRNNIGPKEHPLSPREVDVLCCVAHAMTAKEIAGDLHISVKTVDRHKANIMNKLSMRSQIELARYAIRMGFVEV